jgi:hypothetical protein
MLALFALLIAAILLAHISFGIPALVRRGEHFLIDLTARRPRRGRR